MNIYNLYSKKTGLSDKQAKEWLGSTEHKFFYLGAEKGLTTGICVGAILFIPIGMLIAIYLLK